MSYSSVILGEPGLVSYWRLGETVANQTIADAKDGNSGTTVVGIAHVPGLLVGDSNGASSTNGTTGPYARIPHAANMDTGAALTVEFWIQPSGLSSPVTPVTRTLFGSSWLVRYDNAGRWEADVYDSSGARIFTTAAPGYNAAVGVTQHVVMTYDAAGTFALYINGVDVTTAHATPTLPVATTTSPLDLFNPNHGVSASLTGVLDEVALYNVALTASQVLRHYNTGNGTAGAPNDMFPTAAAATADAPIPTFSLGASSVVYKTLILSEPNLAAYWRLDELSGGAIDIVGNHNGLPPTGITQGVPGLLARDNDTAAASNGTPGNKSQIPYSNAFSASVFSVECWVKPAALPSGTSWGIISSGPSGAKALWRILFAPIVYGCEMTDGSGHAIQAFSAVAVDAGTIAHLVMTFDGTTLRFYVNGAVIVGGTVTGGSASDGVSPIVMFADTSQPSAAGFNGTLDEVAFYTSALTATQVQNHYNGGRTNPPLTLSVPAAAAPGAALPSSERIDTFVPAAA